MFYLAQVTDSARIGSELFATEAAAQHELDRNGYTDAQVREVPELTGAEPTVDELLELKTQAAGRFDLAVAACINYEGARHFTNAEWTDLVAERDYRKHVLADAGMRFLAATLR